jgi:hypothetical protein
VVIDLLIDLLVDLLTDVLTIDALTDVLRDVLIDVLIVVLICDNLSTEQVVTSASEMGAARARSPDAGKAPGLPR